MICLLLVWTTNLLDRTMISFSSILNFQVQFPADNDNTSLLNIVIYIRDTFDSIIEFNMSSITVVSDTR